jgi:hypothetical protein
MNKGKEGLKFVAESSEKKKKKSKKKKKHAASPTPHVPFDICYTKEEWEELKEKNKVEETGVSRSKGPESSAVASSPESLALLTITLQENIIMGMCMLNILAHVMVTLNMLFGCLRFL